MARKYSPKKTRSRGVRRTSYNTRNYRAAPTRRKRVSRRSPARVQTVRLVIQQEPQAVDMASFGKKPAPAPRRAQF